jgi:tryptophan synthase alpha chain
MNGGEQIEAAIDAARSEGRTALVAYITAGYPEKALFRRDLARVASAADVVEVGVPFTDPMADGLTIQRASHAAIEAGVTLRWILNEVESMEPPADAPIVLMSYLNPLLALGYDELAGRAEAAGVAGFIVPDLPLDESAELDAALADRGLALVQLVSPVTSDDRLTAAGKASRGFLYAVTVTGITGGDADSGGDIAGYLRRVVAHSGVPVCAGFGVRSREQVARIGAHVPGVVVGSALVETLERREDPVAFLEYLSGLRDSPEEDR